MKNPFTPTFGIVPPYFAGREDLLGAMETAFGRWPGDPNLISILVGSRGIGKTALLTSIGDKARQAGWIVVDTAAVKGMLDDILQQVMMASEHLISSSPKKTITGITIGQIIGIEWSQETEGKLNWRTKMELILKELEKYDTGIAITIDEVMATDEMIELATAYQLLIRQGAKLALVMAGLPVNTDRLLAHKSVSFLRRARLHRLGKVTDNEIERAYYKTIHSAGKTIVEENLLKAVKASAGFPYMMQLVGFSMWENSGENSEISCRDVESGIRQARTDFEYGVLDSTIRELSKGDCRFLTAMLEDPEFSRVSDIAKRLGKTPGYASTYKNRLLLAGVIEEQPGNTVTFALPFFREYIREHYV